MLLVTCVSLGAIHTLALNFITAPDPTRAYWLKRFTRTDDTHFAYREQRQILRLTANTGKATRAGIPRYVTSSNKAHIQHV